MSQDILVPASDWGEASTGPEDADPLPSCTGAIGFKSMWYAVTVPEAAVLRVTVISTDTTRYQPVVTVLDPGRQDELACGVLAVGKAGATATATAYVTPGSRRQRRRSISCASRRSRCSRPRAGCRH